jgi:hypothetical protein
MVAVIVRLNPRRSAVTQTQGAALPYWWASALTQILWLRPSEGLARAPQPANQIGSDGEMSTVPRPAFQTACDVFFLSELMLMVCP